MTALEAAAHRITDIHIALQREAERVAHNKACDLCIEIVAEWLSNGRDPVELFDKLNDGKRWVR